MSYIDQINSAQTSLLRFSTSDPTGYASAQTALNNLKSSTTGALSSQLGTAQNSIAKVGAAGSNMLTPLRSCQALEPLFQFLGALQSGAFLNALLAEIEGATGTGDILAATTTLQNALQTALNAATAMQAAFDSAVQALAAAVGLMKNPCTLLNHINSLGDTIDEFAPEMATARDAVNSIADTAGEMPKLTADTVASVSSHISAASNLDSHITTFNSAISGFF